MNTDDTMQKITFFAIFKQNKIINTRSLYINPCKNETTACSCKIDMTLKVRQFVFPHVIPCSNVYNI